MRRPLLAVAALLALSACGGTGSEQPVVKDAKVRLAAVTGRPAAGYFTVVGGRADDRLVRIDSAVVDRIELHETVMSGGMMKMRPLAELAVPAGAKVTFEPGGAHAMLYGVDPRITPGTGIPMLFTFASGAKVQTEAKTSAAGDDMGGMHH